MTLISRLIWEDEGQNLVEYALVVGLVALAAIAVMGTTSLEIKAVYDKIATKLKTITP